MSKDNEVDDDLSWAEINAMYKERHRKHVSKNMEDYEKYVLEMQRLGFDIHAVGQGIRFTHSTGLRIDFWKQSGKWTVVGTNKYTLGPKKMIAFAKERLDEHQPQDTSTVRRQDDGEVGFTLKGNVSTPNNWPPNARAWNTHPDSPPWET